MGTRFLGRPSTDVNGGPISAHAPTCPLGARGEWVTQCVTPRQTCLQPNGFRRNLRSKTRWFTGFCNSHQVSHFATFFIDARAEISVAESRFDFYRRRRRRPRAHRFRGGGSALFRSGSLAQRRAGVRWYARERAPGIRGRRARRPAGPRRGNGFSGRSAAQVRQ